MEHDLEASEKTVTDTLLSMADYGWLRKTSSGRGGHPTTFSK
ncbi:MULTISPECIES: hypothetical protein [Halobacterium]|nr:MULTISPECIES: hypothetical protein [Halobacterium]